MPPVEEAPPLEAPVVSAPLEELPPELAPADPDEEPPEDDGPSPVEAAEAVPPPVAPWPVVPPAVCPPELLELAEPRDEVVVPDAAPSPPAVELEVPEASAPADSAVVPEGSTGPVPSATDRRQPLQPTKPPSSAESMRASTPLAGLRGFSQFPLLGVSGCRSRRIFRQVRLRGPIAWDHRESLAGDESQARRSRKRALTHAVDRQVSTLPPRQLAP